jgi:hypothetical protein
MNCPIYIETVQATNVSTNSFTAGGNNIIAVNPIVEKGIVWGGDNPTIFDKKISMGKGFTSFSISVSNLPSNLTIKYRAYAIDNTGNVGYGKLLSVILLNNSTDCKLYVKLQPGQDYVIPSGYEYIDSSSPESLYSECIDDFGNAAGLECYVLAIGENQYTNIGTFLLPFDFVVYHNLKLVGVKVGNIKYEFDQVIDYLTDEYGVINGFVQGSASIVNNSILVKQLDKHYPNMLANMCITWHEASAFSTSIGVNSFYSFKTNSSIAETVTIYGTVEFGVDSVMRTVPIEFPMISRSKFDETPNNVSILETLCKCE